MLERYATMASITWIALLALSGCIFDTRSPEGGDVPVCYEEQPSVTIEQVFENLDGALECFQASTYLTQLADDFLYVPAPGIPLTEPWTKVEEEQFISRLFSDAEDIQSSLRLADVQPPQGETTVLVEAQYSITVSTGGSSITFSGEALYTLVTTGSFFRMTRWEEKDSGSPMALLRAGS